MNYEQWNICKDIFRGVIPKYYSYYNKREDWDIDRDIKSLWDNFLLERNRVTKARPIFKALYNNKMMKNSSIVVRSDRNGRTLHISIFHVPYEMVVENICASLRKEYEVSWKLEVDRERLTLRTKVGEFFIVVAIYEKEAKSCRIVTTKTEYHKEDVWESHKYGVVCS